MNKREYCQSFLEAIKNKEDNLYRFFTKRTIIYSLNDKKTISLDEFFAFIKENLQEGFIVKRTFESAVCVKFEIVAKINIDLFIEVKDRRFALVEYLIK